jgi:carbon storage regulator
VLILSRKSKESIVIGGDEHFERVLKVTVLEVKDGRVKLGFDANREIPVYRSEVWERVQAERSLHGTMKAIMRARRVRLDRESEKETLVCSVNPLPR